MVEGYHRRSHSFRTFAKDNHEGVNYARITGSLCIQKKLDTNIRDILGYGSPMQTLEPRAGPLLAEYGLPVSPGYLHLVQPHFYVAQHYFLLVLH